MTDLDLIDRLPAGAFKLLHNDEVGVGAFITPSANGFTFWDGSRTFEITNAYDIEDIDGVTVFNNEGYESRFEISELTEDDFGLAPWIPSTSSVEELQAAVLLNLTALLPGEQAPPPQSMTAAASDLARDDSVETLAFTVDEEGNVLELIKSNSDGVFVRDTEAWTPVDTSLDQPTIDDQEWLDVNADAIIFWDQNADNDINITRDDVLKYAANSE